MIITGLIIFGGCSIHYSSTNLVTEDEYTKQTLFPLTSSTPIFERKLRSQSTKQNILINSNTKPILDLTNIPSSAFVSTWDTSNILASTNSTETRQITLPLTQEGKYDFSIDWGDGEISTITQWNQSEVTHTYEKQGEYTLIIDGDIIGWRSVGYKDKDKLKSIQQWGNLHLGNNGHYFEGNRYMQILATDTLNLTGTTSLAYMFKDCLLFTGHRSMNNWNVSHITDMRYLFYRTSFDTNITSWNVSAVRSMKAMFYGSTFNSPLDTWNTSNVIDMSYMFHSSSFNKMIQDWNVSSVKNMKAMFAYNFNFQQPINNWKVSSVVDLSQMFRSAILFNQPLNKWKVPQVVNMSYMFDQTWYFNQDLNNWNVSGVSNMENMFYKSSFNRTLKDWNVINVENFARMFAYAKFSGDISTWNISNAKSMLGMFHQNQISTIIYDKLLLAWSTLPLQPGVEFSAGNSYYSIQSVSARDYIISTYDWKIKDKGIFPTSQMVNTSLSISQSAISKLHKEDPLFTETSSIRLYIEFLLIVFLLWFTHTTRRIRTRNN